MSHRIPAPWQLEGDGYLLIYKFKKQDVAENRYSHYNADLPYRGGLGCVMLADYRSSDAGPYREILLVPGKYEFEKKSYSSISKIYVSSEESRVNGRRNWGIPKELAHFDFSPGRSANEEEIRIAAGEDCFFTAKAKAYGPRFPVSTSLFRFSLCQMHEGKVMLTRLEGTGRARLARIRIDSVDERYFPDLRRITPLLAVRMEGFQLECKEAEVKQGIDLV
ncbi:acetoacetate decarboxylase family protein [Gorillibacterium sp. CAU 1737]|uniref:acetoacetate decarboxylase family protein n=1 Tax=Gorillibacterium sp. CAU 1737 TaxID=3140362 RepID=UPI003260C4B7